MRLNRLFATTLICLSCSALAEPPKQLLWGDSHLHTSFSSDAFANNNLTADPDTAYRYATGQPVIHPYQLGLIGSTDSHTALSSAEESNFHGKLATDSIPENKTQSWGEEDGGTSGWAMSASGMAAIWATDNTRESIMAAMKRREVYGTTGPRIAVQFFAGWHYSDDDLQGPDLYARARDAGVPMGGELAGTVEEAVSPSFIIQAVKDPGGANLDRIQIVKGWLDASGSAQEQVFNVSWSGERSLGSDGRLPALGSTVDSHTGRSANEGAGSAQLITRWQDPEFDASQSAFYYARVLQVPTARHSLLDALALGQSSAEGQPDTLQERAYTSPIWYRPAGTARQEQ